MKKAIIMGIDGQDGSYLVELLMSKNYDVIGWVPNNTTVSLDNIEHLLDDLIIVKGELIAQDELFSLLDIHQPCELYNLASPSSPALSWENVVYKSNVTALGVARILEAIRLKSPNTRFYQASSSEIFGNPVEIPQNEDTPFNPRNPYGIAKLYAHWLTKNYRKEYGLFAISGILFNHESPRRGMNYVTRKITLGAVKIKLGLINELRMGNLDSRRDWGYAKDYVKAIWLMLQQQIPTDYVIGSGITHSVREICDSAFSCLDLDYKEYVKVVPEYFRPLEGNQLVADWRKAKKELNWEPTCGIHEVIEMMVQEDLRLLKGSEIDDDMLTGMDSK